MYLLGGSFAFTGVLDAHVVAALLSPDLVTPDTVLCSSRDDGSICASVRAAPAAGAALQLDAAGLAAWLRAHPDAIVVDVREAYEQAACMGQVFDGATVQRVPLSRLAGEVAGWLRKPQRPLVFFCRSGNRSARAAACLRRLGHGAAWQLNGGMAMAASAPRALSIVA